MDVVVRGRNVEVPDHYRQHVTEKIARVERYDHKIIRVDVELYHERNRRQSAACQRVEVTCKTRGPVVRAEACAGDFYSALDAAVTKLEGRLRKAADRRRVHRGVAHPHLGRGCDECAGGRVRAGADGRRRGQAGPDDGPRRVQPKRSRLRSSCGRRSTRRSP